MANGDATRGRFSPVRPLLAGDVLDGDRVAGFAWRPGDGGKPSTHLDDKLLLAGDEHLATPPERVVPQTSEGAVECAPMPPADLGDGAVRPGASVDPTVPHRVDALLDLPGAPWQPVARLLFASVHATGHRAWLSGGVVRDVVSGVGERRINDLDLSGTVPAGRFTDILYQSLRASRMSEFHTTVTPDSLVCAVTPPGSRDRLIEYRGLSATGFRFPAVGSSLTEDVRQRDFTFNALFYDVLDHELFDPSGSGVADLTADKRKFVPLKETDDPYARAEVVIRALKFALRWGDAAEPDLTGLNAWLTRLDPDLCRAFTAGQWRRLTRAYERAVKADKAEQRAFAARLAQPGRELLETLIGGAK
ncbi:hypothetical protein [Saccharothrix deserti]|uniref:hypothetical protein n=1 Tax=Saccharothrix deserti TaxID=2593674 RepID=UPI00131B8769|nr:hypothetical protein [Saccharothrix deserti]